MSNRTEFAVVRNPNGSKFTTQWEGKEYSAASPLALDKALDKAGAPRPRTFRINA